MANTDDNLPAITDDTLSAIDVIRCVYLARMAEKRGDSQAARRWQAKIDCWLERISPPPDIACSTTALRSPPENEP